MKLSPSSSAYARSTTSVRSSGRPCRCGIFPYRDRTLNGFAAPHRAQTQVSLSKTQYPLMYLRGTRGAARQRPPGCPDRAGRPASTRLSEIR